MTDLPTDRRFAGSIPQLYERHLVPLIFAPYAHDLAARTARSEPGEVLELAAGTGVLTRELARALPAGARLVATDVNAPMLAEAAAAGSARPVEWREADALALPFADAAFDAVVCQFGAMFFADRPRAYAEARRVLRPGGRLLFNVWDRLDTNVFADLVTQALAARFHADPPTFLARLPHGYHDPARIAEDLRRGGYAAAPQCTCLTFASRAASADAVAFAYCHGTPLRHEIEAHGPTALEAATAAATARIAQVCGDGAVEAPVQAWVIEVARD